jgi:adenylate kinase
MHKYIIMGVQGSGKGTQAKLLAERLDLEHISVGDIFRWNVQHHTKLGAQVRRSLAAGELVADDLVAAVVHRRLSEHDWNYGFIIDGFPRNQPQARFFLESYDLDAVILLEVPDQLVRDRILSRRLCSRCGVDYNLISSRPAAEGVCDVCGGGLVARPTTPLRQSRAACGTITRRPGRSWSGSGPRRSSWPSTRPDRWRGSQAAMREQLDVDTSAYRLLPTATAPPRPWAVASHPR